MIRPSALLTVLFALALLPASPAAPADFARLTSKADLESTIASNSDPALRQALKEHSAAILAAIAQHPHVGAVTRIVEGARGKVEKTNATPEALRKLAGGDMPVFDTLKLIDLAVPNTGPHDKRDVDPYDAAFFEHVGHITALESLNIISTKFGDDWMTPIAGLTNLRTLRFINNGKLSDIGLEKLAGLRNIEAFSYIGTAMTGRAFAKFENWTHLTKCSFRGSSIDDEGLSLICGRFPNLESLILAHAKFTDAGAPHLAKLTRLRNLELGTHNATPASLRHITALPVEYLQLGEGFDSPDSLAIIKDLKTLKRLTLTNCARTTDDDLRLIAAMTQLESLELGNLPLNAERIALLKPFAFLKSLRLVHRPQEYPADIQAKIAQLLPKVQLTFQ